MIGAYRTTWSNLAVAIGVALAAFTVASDLTGGSGGATMWSWRVPVAVVVGGALCARAMRRGVIVTRSGIEGRRLWISWRVPWSAVEECGTGDPLVGEMPPRGRLLVTLLDGTVRHAWVGAGRRGDPAITEAMSARLNSSPKARAYQDPNWPLVACLGCGIGLLGAMAVAETGQMNQDLARRGVVTYDADGLRELATEIAIAQLLIVVCALGAVTTGIWAVVAARQERGVAPLTRWPAQLSFPTTGVGRFDRSPILTILDGRVRDADDELVATVSHRLIPWTSISVSTYWTAPATSDFSVHQTGRRWHLTSWRSPLNARLEEDGPGGSGLVLSVADHAVGRVNQKPPSTFGLATSYIARDGANRVIGEISRSRSAWTCSLPPDTPHVTRRLLCVATVWAEHRYNRQCAND